MFYYTFFEAPCATLLLIGSKMGLSSIVFCDKKELISKEYKQDDAFFKEVKKELNEYFNGERKKFSIKLDIKGTFFQKSVWKELLKIPYGKTLSYQEIAYKIGNEKACRAVGNANNKNPLPIVIPCHRVIGARGKLSGYAGGVEVKKFLLDLESDACLTKH